MDFIQDHQGQDLPDTRDGAKQIEGMVTMLPGGFFDMPFELFQDGGTDLNY
jgi:hypothetical protein